MTVAALCLAVLSTAAQAQSYNPALFSQMQWRAIGPLRGGRTRAVSGVASEPNVFYFGADDGGVWKSTDYGNSWKPIFDQEPTGSIGALAVAPSNPNVIYVGTGEGNVRPDQATGMGVYKSTDAGKTWTFIGLRETEDISQIAVDPHDADRVFVAALGHIYGPNKERGIFRSTDGGKTWDAIDNGLADDATTNVVREDPKTKGLLFAGTETQTYVSFDNGDHWQSLRLNMPAISVRDLQIKDDDLVAATHGRGFWVLDDITPLRQIDEQVAHALVTLYKPELATRVRWDMNPPTPWRMPALSNPPPGAIIDYYLADNFTGPVTLDILDANGKLVRHFSSANPVKPLDPAKLDVPDWWPRPPMNLSTQAGMHRFAWDMRYPSIPGALQFLDDNQAIIHNTPMTPSSPWIMPGNYTVKLTADGHSYNQPLTVRMDPRVTTPMAALQQQFNLSMRAYSESIAASEALQQIHDLQKQIKAHEKQHGTSKALTAYGKQLETLTGPPMSPFAFYFGFHGAPNLVSTDFSLQILLRRMQDADRAPTSADVTALDETSKGLQTLLTRWTTLKTQLPKGSITE